MNNTTDKLADALQRLVWAIEFNDKDATRERMPAAREAIAEYDATPTADNIATATPAGEVPGIAGQWIPRDRCAALAPLLHKLLDREPLTCDERHAVRILADDLEQGAEDSTHNEAQ